MVTTSKSTPPSDTISPTYAGVSLFFWMRLQLMNVWLVEPRSVTITALGATLRLRSKRA